MKFLYSFLVFLAIYPNVGSLLLYLVGFLKTPTQTKVAILTFGRPLLSIAIIWLTIGYFDNEIALFATYLAVGNFLRVFSTNHKYLSSFQKDSATIKIEYFTELLARKTISLAISDVTEFSLSKAGNFFTSEPVLSVTTSTGVMKFAVLDREASPAI